MWLTDSYLIRCAVNQNSMTRLNFDTLLLSFNHLSIIICEKALKVDFTPQNVASGLVLQAIQAYKNNLI